MHLDCYEYISNNVLYIIPPPPNTVSLRFVNGMKTGLNISGSDDVEFGFLEQFSISNYSLVKGGRWGRLFFVFLLITVSFKICVI